MFHSSIWNFWYILKNGFCNDYKFCYIGSFKDTNFLFYMIINEDILHINEDIFILINMKIYNNDINEHIESRQLLCWFILHN